MSFPWPVQFDIDSSACAAVGGFADVPALLGVAGLVMTVGNLYAVALAGRR